MKLINVRWITTSVLGLVVFGLVAQDAHAGKVLRRERRQQARIAEGEKSGELTAGETKNLEKGEAKIEGAREAALADGKVDPAERRKLNRMENRESRKIWRDKHNNRKAGGAEPATPATPGTPDSPATPATPAQPPAQ